VHLAHAATAFQQRKTMASPATLSCLRTRAYSSGSGAPRAAPPCYLMACLIVDRRYAEACECSPPFFTCNDAIGTGSRNCASDQGCRSLPITSSVFGQPKSLTNERL
jgi:hypothetical protein